MNKSDPKWKQIAEAANKIPDQLKKVLDGEASLKKSPLRPEDPQKPDTEIEDGWRKLNARKWELRSGGYVLGTIFHKPTGKFSIWFKTPMIYDKLGTMTSRSHVCDTYESAVEEFEMLLRAHAEGWCQAALKFLDKGSEIGF